METKEVKKFQQGGRQPSAMKVICEIRTKPHWVWQVGHWWPDKSRFGSEVETETSMWSAEVWMGNEKVENI